MSPAEAIATGQDVTVLPDGTAEVAGVALPGLTEGLLMVAYRIPVEGDFFLGWGEIVKANHGGKWNQPTMIVKLAPGFAFAYNITNNAYQVIRKYAAPKRLTAHFLAHNASEEAAILAVKSNVGFERFEE